MCEMCLIWNMSPRGDDVCLIDFQKGVFSIDINLFIFLSPLNMIFWGNKSTDGVMNFGSHDRSKVSQNFHSFYKMTSELKKKKKKIFAVGQN